MRKSLTHKWFKLDSSYFDYYFNHLERIDRPGCRVLHLGCGWDKRRIKDRFKFARIYSMDCDVAALNRNPNPLKIAGDAGLAPLKNKQFDSVICEDLVEHIREPNVMLREIYYTLKEGGEFVFVTPNRWSYISIAAALTPFRFHRWYNHLRGIDHVDIYPTFYRFNSYGKIMKGGPGNGFEVNVLKIITGKPSYFNFSKILSALFYGVHFLIRLTPASKILGINIFAILKKRR